MAGTIVHIVPMTEDHIVGWRRLWRKNLSDALEPEVLDHTQSQILDSREPLFALLALDGQEVVGLLHGVVHPVAGSLHPVCYMQDLYVHPARRRQGIATRMLDALRMMGMAAKWDRIYWLTDHTNSEARAFYEDKSVALDFTFHILPLGMLEKIKDEKK